MVTSAHAPAGLTRPAPNTSAAIEDRVRAHQISWLGPLVMVFGRTALAVLAQGITAGIFWLQQRPRPWSEAAAWWTVWGTLADLGCLALLAWLVQREGLRLSDLVTFDRRRLGRALWQGALIFAVMFPIAIVGGTMLSSFVVFGTITAPSYAGELTGRVLPWWGVAYSLTIWWLIWSATEELTYNGYALPRLAALSRRPWLSAALVGLMWAIQHAALPLLFDWRYLLWRTLSFLPLAFCMAVIYLRLRRLAPLILAHWAMDLFGALFTLAW
jgi:membrane protease YdiL (CAAX protease family)